MLSTGAEAKTESCIFDHISCHNENSDSDISCNVTVFKEHITDDRNIPEYRNFVNVKCIRKLYLLYSLDHTSCKNRKCRSK